MEVPAALTGEKPTISIWLSSNRSKEEKFFCCPVCGHKVFSYYTDQKIQIMSGKGEFVKSPIGVQCNGALTIVRNGQLITTRCKTLFYIA